MMLKVLILLTAAFSTTTAQTRCADPMEIGELRVKNSRKCLDIKGDTGRGEIQTYKCDGGDDQQIIVCGDGTIRNAASPNYCLTPDSNGNGDVKSEACEVHPSLPEHQKWRYGRERTFTDVAGFQQVAREIVNVKSGKCLDVAGREGKGDVYAYECQNMDDQHFYFRTKGMPLASGRLQVQESKLCLDVASGSKPSLEDDLRIYECKDSANQYFTFYENGELVNTKSRLCVDVSGTNGDGNVQMYACDDYNDQMYSRPDVYCNGDFCAFHNRASRRCLDVEGRGATSGSEIVMSSCDGSADQLFKWVTEKWVTPDADWTLVGCNQNGEVSQTISNSIEYSQEISTSVSLEIAYTVEAGVEFASTSLSTTVSTSLSSTWSESQSESRDITFKCENYDDGTTFKKGCMWQLIMKTHKTTDDDELTWKPQIVKCTSSDEKPRCPPFTKCSDKACTQCIGFIAKKAKISKPSKVKSSKSRRLLHKHVD